MKKIFIKENIINLFNKDGSFLNYYEDYIKSNNIVEMTQDIKSIIYIIGPISFMCKNLKIKKKTIMRLFLKKNLKLL
jgi:hypothetical protein